MRMSGNAGRATLDAIGDEYPAVSNILKQTAIMA
jgi:hypothetical protein